MLLHAMHAQAFHLCADNSIHIAQIGRGKTSLTDAYTHSYQESKVPIVTPAGKHIGEVEIFFAFASKEVSKLTTQQAHLHSFVLPRLAHREILKQRRQSRHDLRGGIACLLHFEFIGCFSQLALLLLLLLLATCGCMFCACVCVACP